MTPADEEQVFNAVYEDRVAFLKKYPKDLADLEAWKDSLEKQKILSEHQAIANKATIKAYDEEIKRQLLLKLISQ